MRLERGLGAQRVFQAGLGALAKSQKARNGRGGGFGGSERGSDGRRKRFEKSRRA